VTGRDRRQGGRGRQRVEEVREEVVWLPPAVHRPPSVAARVPRPSCLSATATAHGALNPLRGRGTEVRWRVVRVRSTVRARVAATTLYPRRQRVVPLCALRNSVPPSAFCREMVEREREVEVAARAPPALHRPVRLPRYQGTCESRQAERGERGPPPAPPASPRHSAEAREVFQRWRGGERWSCLPTRQRLFRLPSSAVQTPASTQRQPKAR